MLSGLLVPHLVPDSWVLEQQASGQQCDSQREEVVRDAGPGLVVCI